MDKTSCGEPCEEGDGESQVNDLQVKIFANLETRIFGILEEAQSVAEVWEEDIVEIPELGIKHPFPFAGNAVMVADSIGSHGECRIARVTRVFLLSDFAGQYSVNWVGNLMAPNGQWLDMEVLLARVGGQPKEPIKLVG